MGALRIEETGDASPDSVEDERPVRRERRRPRQLFEREERRLGGPSSSSWQRGQACSKKQRHRRRPRLRRSLVACCRPRRASRSSRPRVASRKSFPDRSSRRGCSSQRKAPRRSWRDRSPQASLARRLRQEPFEFSSRLSCTRAGRPHRTSRRTSHRSRSRARGLRWRWSRCIVPRCTSSSRQGRSRRSWHCPFPLDAPFV
jgi:hypothetical protein